MTNPSSAQVGEFGGARGYYMSLLLWQSYSHYISLSIF